MSKPGKLYLLPVPISGHNALSHIPLYNLDVIKRLRFFIAEDAKTARRHLKLFSYPEIEKAEILLLNEHTNDKDITHLLEPLLNGNDVGLMSDAGCPGIADPGATVAALAHQKGVEVVPLTGPSSIVMSIMASGFNGQNFAFVGYLPIEKPLRSKRIKELEQLAQKQGQAQFFIETPYRNEQMLETLIATLNGETLLFIGLDISGPQQFLQTRTAAQWKKGPKPALHKIPAVFGIFGGKRY